MSKDEGVHQAKPIFTRLKVIKGKGHADAK